MPNYTTYRISDLELVELVTAVPLIGKVEAVKSLAKKISPICESFINIAQARISELPLAKNENGLYSGKSLVMNHIAPNKVLLGMYYVLMHNTRGDFVPEQSSTNRNYSSLVPLILAGYKKYRNIPYSSWDPSEIETVVHRPLAEAMVADISEIDLSIDELLELQKLSLTVKSGSKKDSIRPAHSTYSIYPPRTSLVGKLPTLAQIMLLQVWCAHPKNRTKDMVLDPSDWDEMPDALISENLAMKAPVNPWD